MELVMMFLTVAAVLLMSLGLRGWKVTEPETTTRPMFVAGFAFLLLDIWCYCAYYGIFFN